MPQNTYTVTVNNIDGAETVVVQGAGASHDRDSLIIWADADATRAAAVFRRWEHVTVERPEPLSAGPFQGQERDCTSPDCLKHNGYAHAMAQIFTPDEPYSELIDLDKRIAEVVNDSKATALLIERAARTGFAAGLAAAMKSKS